MKNEQENWKDTFADLCLSSSVVSTYSATCLSVVATGGLLRRRLGYLDIRVGRDLDHDQEEADIRNRLDTQGAGARR